MSELSQADRFLLEKIRQGDADAWTQLVDRYRGRLLAFAQSRLRGGADAEDLLQDAFLCFLRGAASFRGEAALETYLFTILRRRIIDWYRGRRANICLLQDVVRGRDDDDAEPLDQIPAPDPSASWYARRRERDHLQRLALASAIRGLVNAHKRSLNFRDLKVVEMLFYAQLANRRVAEVAGIDAAQVGLIKHRCLKKVRRAVARELASRGLDSSAEAASDAMLTEVWEDLRISCPKRSTVGAYLLGTLEAPWRDYVDFHLHKLGCRFCLANLADLEARTRPDETAAARSRILESTIGFLRQSYLRRNGGAGPRSRDR